MHWVTETETMENFAGSLLPVEIEQGSLKSNYDHKLRTGMKRNPRMKLFSPKFRTWIGRQWNVRTLYESGKEAKLAVEMRRYRTQQIRIEESIMRRKWKWIRHTLRKPENNITRCALEWNPQESRRRGRPKQSWRRSVIAELAKNKITWIEAKRTASNRVRWRSMVDALCSPLGAKMA